MQNADTGKDKGTYQQELENKKTGRVLVGWIGLIDY